MVSRFGVVKRRGLPLTDNLIRLLDCFQPERFKNILADKNKTDKGRNIRYLRHVGHLFSPQDAAGFFFFHPMAEYIYLFVLHDFFF